MLGPLVLLLGLAATMGSCGPRERPGSDATTLTIMLAEGPRTMDPADHTLTLTGAVLSPMYEGLVRDTPLGPAPLLATGWKASTDGLTWVFQLRENVRFHDGSPLNAAAAVLSFRRLIAPGSALAAAGRFAPVIRAVDAVGPMTLRFSLKKPYADLPVLLASNQACIVGPKAAASARLDREADGTGPFRFVSWRPGVSAVEGRNEVYWGPRPRLKRLRWISSAEPSVLYMALRTGDADVAAPLSPVFAVQTARNRALRLLRQPGRTFFWVALNVRLRPFDDPRVREALSLATDRAALVFALLGGFGSPAETPLAASTPYALPPADRLAYDPIRARQLLQAAGWGRGLRIALAAQDSDESIVEALQAMWAKVGVTVEIRRLEAGVYAAAAYAPPQQKAVEGLGGVVASWSSGVVPELQLRPLFAGSSAAPAGANLGFFADPRVDRLLDDAESTADPARRKDLYAAVQSLILGAEPAVLLYTRDDLVGLSRGVGGVRVSPDGALDVLWAAKT